MTRKLSPAARRHGHRSDRRTRAKRNIVNSDIAAETRPFQAFEDDAIIAAQRGERHDSALPKASLIPGEIETPNLASALIERVDGQISDVGSVHVIEESHALGSVLFVERTDERRVVTEFARRRFHVDVVARRVLKRVIEVGTRAGARREAGVRRPVDVVEENVLVAAHAFFERA